MWMRRAWHVPCPQALPWTALLRSRAFNSLRSQPAGSSSATSWMLVSGPPLAASSAQQSYCVHHQHPPEQQRGGRHFPTHQWTELLVVPPCTLRRSFLLLPMQACAGMVFSRVSWRHCIPEPLKLPQAAPPGRCAMLASNQRYHIAMSVDTGHTVSARLPQLSMQSACRDSLVREPLCVNHNMLLGY